MKFFLACLITTSAFASPQIEEAKKSIQTLIRPLIGETSKRPKGTEKFRVDGCEKKKINWMDVMLGKDSANMEFLFQEGCDIEGKVKLRVLQDFPLDLRLRNLQSYNHVKTNNKITADLDRKPILNLQMREGILTGKDTVKFEADYKVRIDPTKKKKIDKNLGGELRISEINGKKIDIKEKIYVK
jgi:hypothetical protein